MTLLPDTKEKKRYMEHLGRHNALADAHSCSWEDS